MNIITNTDTNVLPYNDDHMEYDLDSRMYLLTDKGIKDLTGYDILLETGTTQNKTRIKQRISLDVYNYIKRYSKLHTIKQKIYQIAKDEDTREIFKQALAEQALYYIESGAGALKTQHGVNIANGKALDLDVLRGRVLISPSAEILLSSVGLLFTGNLYSMSYLEDGTW